MAGDSVGQVKVVAKNLAAGDQATIAKNGPVSFVAVCTSGAELNKVAVFGATTVDGAMLRGGSVSLGGQNGSDDDFYLLADTPESSRKIGELSAGGEYGPGAVGTISGFIQSPTAHFLSVDLVVGGLDGADCVVRGTATVIKK